MEAVSVALSSLRSSKLRSFLTLLGIILSTTTLIVVIFLFIFGGAVINDFAYALMVGVVVGTYSSIYIASPVVVYWETIRARSSKRAKAGRRAAKR